MRDVQTILAHAHLSTTAEIYLVEQQAEVIRRVQRHLTERLVGGLAASECWCPGRECA